MMAARLLGVLCVLSMGARADEVSWAWHRGDGQDVGVSNAGGDLHAVRARFDGASGALSFRVVFSDRRADGFTLVLNDGPDAAGSVGRFAMLHLDATRNHKGGDVRLSAYAYNGKNRSGFRDGDAISPGSQTPDLIHSYLDRSWIRSVSSRNIGDSKRVMKFSIDASAILAHTPLHGEAADWFGIGFASRLGIWLRTYDQLRTVYNEDGTIRRWRRGSTGFLDGTDLATSGDDGGDDDPIVVIPMPGSAAMALAGVGAVALRRRR